VAIRILIAPGMLPVYRNHAHRLLVSFVEDAMVLYGPEFMSYNVHSLLHLASDAERFGIVQDSIAAYKRTEKSHHSSPL
jgi:hypothetical protein